MIKDQRILLRLEDIQASRQVIEDPPALRRVSIDDRANEFPNESRSIGTV
jgi:hypothetical protein